MDTKNYGISDGNGNQLRGGIQGKEHALELAQEIADERGELVEVWEYGEGGFSAIVRPAAEAR